MSPPTWPFRQHLDDDDGTFGAEEEEVELAGIVSAPLPDLSAADLVTFEPGAGSGDPFSLVLPSLHPSRATAQTAFGIFQRRLRSPAREHYEAQQAEQPTGSSPIGSVPLMMHVVSGALITWTADEKQQLRRVIEFAGRFIAEWVRAMLADVAVMKRLAELVERMERVFYGVYQACVRDMLSIEPGFHTAVGLARSVRLWEGIDAELREAARRLLRLLRLVVLL